LFNLAVFFLFGMIVIMYWAEFDARYWLYAVLSLTVVRMLPVAVALAGTGLSRASVVFMGWFGPRGLASIVLGLVYLEQEMKFPGESTIRLVVILTVVISIFVHGLSAKSGINLYARKVAALDTGAPELQEASS
jgi:NhaP-type Na+/H+ or K+/H+ antiporter